MKLEEVFQGRRRGFVIAEVAQAHDGSLGMAHAYIEAAARAGADAVKFQTHIAAEESTKREPWRVRFSPQDETRYDYWKRMEFTEEQWAGLKEHAEARGLTFLSSAFSMAAVEMLERIRVEAWKVGAGEVTNLPMLERMGAAGRPVILSSGMSRWSEMDAAVEAVRRKGAAVAVLQCTTAYPCPPEKVGLNVMAEIRRRYGCPTGLSDHSGTIYAGLGAAALGAEILEVHVVFSRECFGPDVPASVTTAELKQLVEGVRFLERVLQHPVDKDAEAETMGQIRRMFGKSVVAARRIEAGEIVDETMIAFKKPGDGLRPAEAARLLGRRARRRLEADELILEEDVEP